MRQCHQRIAADDCLKSEKTAEAQLAVQLTRAPHMHEPSLHPAFEPARALPEPAAQACRRFFAGGGIDYAASIAKSRQPNAEIGIFGDIIRIPTADFVKHF